MPDPFTYADANAALVTPAGIETRVTTWQQRRGTSLSRWVLGFTHTTLPEVTPEDVRSVLSRSSHALGYLTKEHDTERLIADANPPWALMYLFHDCMERQGRVPTWGEFYSFVTGPAERRWWAVVREASKRRKLDQLHAIRAATWRLATAWQSAIRTVYALAVLRHEHDVDARYHLFAHVELRVDGWHGDRAYRLVMPSEYERKKTDPRTILGGAVTVEDVEVVGYGRGVVYLPSDTALARLARWLGEGQDTGTGQIRLTG